eukprot:GEMP01012342.1.p1 GENE.GEMP01012342.1~~GEMP01012342.1.p1  ORF type:complete len:1001 (+),score=200.77 GEMP01012342.1:71-3073(+)
MAFIREKDVDCWTTDEVAEWVRNLKGGQDWVATFKDNEVDGATLTALSKEDLRSDLGIENGLFCSRVLGTVLLLKRTMANRQQSIEPSSTLAPTLELFTPPRRNAVFHTPSPPYDTTPSASHDDTNENQPEYEVCPVTTDQENSGERTTEIASFRWTSAITLTEFRQEIRAALGRQGEHIRLIANSTHYGRAECKAHEDCKVHWVIRVNPSDNIARVYEGGEHSAKPRKVRGVPVTDRRKADKLTQHFSPLQAMNENVSEAERPSEAISKQALQAARRKNLQPKSVGRPHKINCADSITAFQSYLETRTKKLPIQEWDLCKLLLPEGSNAMMSRHTVERAVQLLGTLKSPRLILDGTYKTNVAGWCLLATALPVFRWCRSDGWTTSALPLSFSFAPTEDYEAAASLIRGTDDAMGGILAAKIEALHTDCLAHSSRLAKEVLKDAASRWCLRHVQKALQHAFGPEPKKTLKRVSKKQEEVHVLDDNDCGEEAEEPPADNDDAIDEQPWPKNGLFLKNLVRNTAYLPTLQMFSAIWDAALDRYTRSEQHEIVVRMQKVYLMFDDESATWSASWWSGLERRDKGFSAMLSQSLERFWGVLKNMMGSNAVLRLQDPADIVDKLEKALKSHSVWIETLKDNGDDEFATSSGALHASPSFPCPKLLNGPVKKSRRRQDYGNKALCRFTVKELVEAGVEPIATDLTRGDLDHAKRFTVPMFKGATVTESPLDHADEHEVWMQVMDARAAEIPAILERVKVYVKRKDGGLRLSYAGLRDFVNRYAVVTSSHDNPCTCTFVQKAHELRGKKKQDAKNVFGSCHTVECTCVEFAEHYQCEHELFIRFHLGEISMDSMKGKTKKNQATHPKKTAPNARKDLPALVTVESVEQKLAKRKMDQEERMETLFNTPKRARRGAPADKLAQIRDDLQQQSAVKRGESLQLLRRLQDEGKASVRTLKEKELVGENGIPSAVRRIAKDARTPPYQRAIASEIENKFLGEAKARNDAPK